MLNFDERENTAPGSVTAQVLNFSNVIGATVLGSTDEVIGSLKDLIISVGGEQFPTVTGLVVAIPGRRSHRFFISTQFLASLHEKLCRLTTSTVNLRPFARRDGEALLENDVLDKQIIDINGRRVIRVNDVTLTNTGNGWVLAGADVSTAALLDRLGIRSLAARLPREVIPWDSVQFFATEVPGARIQLKYDNLAKLHPTDLAKIISDLGYQQGSEVIAALDESVAAQVVENVDIELQSAMIGAMDVDDAADILDEMSPDMAADLLADLPEEDAENLLDAMEAPEAADVKRLLDYHPETAGGVMTTEYVAVPKNFTAEQILEGLRSSEELPDLISYIYVVEGGMDARLVGVATMRALLLAPRGAPVSDFMLQDLVVGHVHDPADEVARSIADGNLLALPIVDDEMNLCGVVTVDTALSVILPDDWKHRLPRIIS